MKGDVLGEHRRYTAQVDTHDHPYAQLIFPIQGHLVIETTTHNLKLSDSQLFFLPPRCRHTFYALDDNECLVLDISAPLVTEPEWQTAQGGMSVPLDDQWQALRYLMLVETRDRPIVEQHLRPLFLYAYARLQQPQTPRSVRYIEQHLASPLTVEQLAAIEGYSPTYYCEWFKQWMGRSPGDYIQHRRLETAKTLLRESDLPILAIAQQVGYEHHASFSRAFQQQVGCSPTAYRKTSRIAAQ